MIDFVFLAQCAPLFSFQGKDANIRTLNNNISYPSRLSTSDFRYLWQALVLATVAGRLYAFGCLPAFVFISIAKLYSSQTRHMLANPARHGSTERIYCIGVIGWRPHLHARPPAGAKSVFLARRRGTSAPLPASHQHELGIIHDIIYLSLVAYTASWANKERC
jgi:hypothetical protein